MREQFVTDLAKNLLGPRGGPREVLERGYLPFSEYVTGMLVPVGQEQAENECYMAVGGDLPVGAGRPGADDDGGGHGSDDDVAASTVPTADALAINPSRIPSSMGVSFCVRAASGEPLLDACLTWSKYAKLDDGGWIREPRYAIARSLRPPATVDYDGRGGKGRGARAEVRLSSEVRPLGQNRHLVSVFMTNVSQGRRAEETVFQAQIRIVCGKGTVLVPLEGEPGEQSEAEKRDAFVYRERQSYGRGHMTSAVWHYIDPEIMQPDIASKYAPFALDPPFKWVDGAVLPPGDAERFSRPDIRTEFLPMLSIPVPEVAWDDDLPQRPVLRAGELADMWDASRLRDALSAIPAEYKKWIGRMDAVKDGRNDGMVARIQDECRAVLSRIEGGIERLAADEDARMAFCFANKAVDLASRWPRASAGAAEAAGGMEYRPFQIAFVLMSLDSVLDPASRHRGTCDMLWVPTAAGKTEAYLVLVALSMAHRRIREMRRGGSGAGVDVISRYTLRLLTIQQFRRTLRVICAAEQLRVANLSHGKAGGRPIGWRPEGCGADADFLWGSTPFSLGLWVGGKVTPNRLEDGGYKGSTRGALSILKSGRADEDGEPAQVLNCPACGGITAVPEKGLAPSKTHTISWAVRTDASAEDLAAVRVGPNDVGAETLEIDFDDMPGAGCRMLRASFSFRYDAGGEEVGGMWNKIADMFKAGGVQLELECASATRPGYFCRTYITERSAKREYDFDIVCTNGQCPLQADWMGGTECGRVAGTRPSPYAPATEAGEAGWLDGNLPIEALPCFARSAHVSSRIPITALTVDDQVYRHAPTAVIATVDKFARLPFEPQAGMLFGNAEWCNLVHGYYRLDDDDNHLQPRGRSGASLYREVRPPRRPARPSLIIQDELHLIEGPLGSLVGLYETCVDFLASGEAGKVKYLAATATIKNGDDQVRSLFARDLQVFPPLGTDISDRFFVREANRPHPLLDGGGGRLHVGMIAPGRGAQTPLVRTWARLSQTGHRCKGEGLDVDDYWTVTGYFNTIKELAGTRALYMQNIPDWIRQIDRRDPRDIPDTRVQELSGRMTSSSKIPSTLEILEREYSADALFTTSMFGTGVDIRRIGVMIVVGQPKTTSAYIQSTGRVGRKRGGLVPVFHKASRPRDLSHYEYFCRNHLQLHRRVEPPTVSPFSSGTMGRGLGPMMVGMLRNKRSSNGGVEWALEASAASMASAHGDGDVLSVIDHVASRSQELPVDDRPARADVEASARACISRWKEVAGGDGVLRYAEYYKTSSNVVLGDQLHEASDRETVFANAPVSLREIEGEAGFED